jgi:hypothetical protein
MSENGDLKIGGKYGKWRIIEDTGRLTNWNEKIYKARSDDGKVRNIWYSTSGKKSIKDYVVIGKILQQERWKVILDAPFNGKKTMPLAHYNWLMGNPSFSEIPKGYAIHHLDNDPLNDDISNLALIHKHHHTAYHLKYKILKLKLNIDVILICSIQYTNGTGFRRLLDIINGKIRKPKDGFYGGMQGKVGNQ